MVTEFTPAVSTLGGILIGLSAVMLITFNGRIAGISGIGRLLPPYASCDVGGALLFILGLLAAPLAYAAVTKVHLSRRACQAMRR